MKGKVNMKGKIKFFNEATYKCNNNNKDCNKMGCTFCGHRAHPEERQFAKQLALNQDKVIISSKYKSFWSNAKTKNDNKNKDYQNEKVAYVASSSSPFSYEHSPVTISTPTSQGLVPYSRWMDWQ